MPGHAKKAASKANVLPSRSVASVAGFELVQVGPKRKRPPIPAEDSASVLVQKVGKALRKPGIDKQTVFRGGATRVFSYSAYPSDPTRVVREASDGTKRIGRLVKGKFVAAKTV